MKKNISIIEKIELERKGTIFPNSKFINFLSEKINVLRHDYWNTPSFFYKKSFFLIDAPMHKSHTVIIGYGAAIDVLDFKNYVKILFDSEKELGKFKYLNDTPFFFPRNKLTREIKLAIKEFKEL